MVAIVVYNCNNLLHLLRQNEKKYQVIGFILFLFFYTLSLIFLIFFHAAETVQTAKFWYRFSFISRPLLFASMILLVYSFFQDNRPIPFWIIALFYLPAIPVVITGTMGLIEIQDIVLHTDGNIVVFSSGKFWTIYYILYFVYCIVFHLAFIIRKIIVARNNRTRILGKTLFYCILVPAVLAALLKYPIPAFFADHGIHVPRMDYLAIFLGTWGALYAYRKYSFMRNDVPYNLENILEQMRDGIILTNREGNVTYCNNTVTRFAGYACNGQRNEVMHISKLLPGCDIDTSEADNLQNTDFQWRNTFMRLSTGEKRYVQIYYRFIFDDFNDYIGLLVIFQPYNKLENAKKQYNLTKREIEIIQLLNSGINNNKIAEILFLSPHTVRNHIQNIYAKTGTHNKYRLLKLVL